MLKAGKAYELKDINKPGLSQIIAWKSIVATSKLSMIYFEKLHDRATGVAGSLSQMHESRGSSK